MFGLGSWEWGWLGILDKTPPEILPSFSEQRRDRFMDWFAVDFTQNLEKDYLVRYFSS